MKKFLFLACAVVATASCAKDEIVDVNIDNPSLIKFSTYVGTNTKGADVTASNIVSGAVGVYAVVDGGVLGTATSVMPNTKLTNSTTYNDNNNDGTSEDFDDVYTGQWATSASYYWPADGKTVYDFYAYYPHVGTADVDAGISTTGVLPSTYHAMETTAIDQEDYLVGGNTDVAYDGEDIDVMLTLGHALSKVDFQIGIKSEKVGTAIEVTITGLELTGVLDNHGGLDLTNSKFAAATAATYSNSTDGTLLTYGSATTTGATFEMAGIEESVGQGDIYTPSATYNSGWVLSDANAFEDDYLSYLVDDAVKIDPSYFSIYAKNSADSVDAFKLLPQTLYSSDTEVFASAPTVQQVILYYTVKQNGVVIADASSGKAFDLYNDDAVTAWTAGSSYLYTITFVAENGELEYKDAVEVDIDVDVKAWPTTTNSEVIEATVVETQDETQDETQS